MVDHEQIDLARVDLELSFLHDLLIGRVGELHDLCVDRVETILGTLLDAVDLDEGVAVRGAERARQLADWRREGDVFEVGAEDRVAGNVHRTTFLRTSNRAELSGGGGKRLLAGFQRFEVLGQLDLAIVLDELAGDAFDTDQVEQHALGAQGL